MTDLSFGNQRAVPGTRRPLIRVELASSSAGAGDRLADGIGSLATAVGVDLGGDRGGWTDQLVGLVATTGMLPDVDAVSLFLAAGPSAPEPALGDRGSVAIGYADAAPTRVFTGEVAVLGDGLDGLRRVELANGGQALAHLRVDQSFEGVDAADIVRDLLGRVDVTAGNLEAGVALPFHALDARRHAAECIATLAARSGFVACFDRDGALDFRPPAASETLATFTHGVDLLGFELAASRPAVEQIAISGEGAAGTAGATAWAWFANEPDPVTTTAGAGTRTRRESDPTLRSLEAVETAARWRIEGAARRASRGRLTVTGNPAVAVGHRVAVEGSPSATLDGEWLVLAIRHTLGPSTGFVTEMRVTRFASGGTGGFNFPGGLG